MKSLASSACSIVFTTLVAIRVVLAVEATSPPGDGCSGSPVLLWHSDTDIDTDVGTDLLQTSVALSMNMTAVMNLTSREAKVPQHMQQSANVEAAAHPNSGDRRTAVVLSICAMALWGSWANTFLLAKTRLAMTRPDLYLLDFLIGIVLISLVGLPTGAGQIMLLFHSGTPGFVILMLSVASGALFAAGMLLSILSVALAGMALTMPLTLGIEFFVGVPLLLLVEGARSPLSTILSAAGVAAVMCAIAFDFVCHTWMLEARNEVSPGEAIYIKTVADSDPDSSEPLPSCTSSSGIVRSITEPDMRALPEMPNFKRNYTEPADMFNKIIRKRMGQKSSIGLLRPPISSINAKTSKLRGDGESEESDSFEGLVFACLAGILFALWPMLCSIVEGSGSAHGFAGVVLEPPAFYIVFASSAFGIASLVLPMTSNAFSGGKIQLMTYYESYKELPVHAHALAVLGGVLQGLGTKFYLKAGMVLGNCVAVSIARCSPVVAALWGVFLWGDLNAASWEARGAFVGMLIAFLSAVALLSAAGLVEP